MTGTRALLDPDGFFLDRFEAARSDIRGIAIRSPLLRLPFDGAAELYVKLENLQPIGSFKVRCGAAALVARKSALRGGASTASAGNFAQGLAFAGQRLGIPVTACVPRTAAQSKLDALRALGARVIPLPYAEWWDMLARPDHDPDFIHPVCEPEGLLGNGTIALEILEDLPHCATVIAPYGGGGLSTGIAMALAAAGSSARVIAAETEAGAPFGAALAAGEPIAIDFDPETFVTGMGGPRVLDAMWPLARRFLAGAATVTLAETAAAIRKLATDLHVIAEGAGAAPVAAALSGGFAGPIVCVVSGGHLDADDLIAVLRGETPRTAPIPAPSANDAAG